MDCVYITRRHEDAWDKEAFKYVPVIRVMGISDTLLSAMYIYEDYVERDYKKAPAIPDMDWQRIEDNTWICSHDNYTGEVTRVAVEEFNVKFPSYKDRIKTGNDFHDAWKNQGYATTEET